MSTDIEYELVKSLAVSNHKFMVELYRVSNNVRLFYVSYLDTFLNVVQVLGASDENVFFSPFSIYVALVLVYLGSNGETAKELQKYLFLPEKREHLLEGIRLLLNDVTKV